MPARPRCQFSLLAMMMATTIVAGVVFHWAELLFLLSLGFHLTTVAITFGALIAGSRMRLLGMRASGRGVMRGLAYSLLALLVCGTLVAYWAASRWEKRPIEPDWPFPLPYPDTLLEMYFRWYYEWRSSPNAGIGPLQTPDFRVVQLSLFGVFWLFSALTAFQIGRMFKQRELLYLMRGATIRRPRPPEIIS